jgi:hypothetical protein
MMSVLAWLVYFCHASLFGMFFYISTKEAEIMEPVLLLIMCVIFALHSYIMF